MIAVFEPTGEAGGFQRRSAVPAKKASRLDLHTGSLGTQQVPNLRVSHSQGACSPVQVCINSFESLVHLASLEKLSICFPGDLWLIVALVALVTPPAGVRHSPHLGSCRMLAERSIAVQPSSVGVLACLPSLRCLVLGNWQPMQPDTGLGALKQLVALHLPEFSPPPGFSIGGKDALMRRQAG